MTAAKLAQQAAYRQCMVTAVIAALCLPDGVTKPYRPCPHDFRDTYLAMGWDGIVDHYRTNWRVIRRWIEESGGDDLRAARRLVTGSAPKPHLRTPWRSRAADPSFSDGGNSASAPR